MYIPSHQYKVVSFVLVGETGGNGEYSYEDDGTPFTGSQYVEFTNGDLYDVPQQDLEKGNFRRARKIKTNALKGAAKLLTFLIPFIPKRPLGKTKMKRFFVKHKVTNDILEVDSDRYSELFTNEPSHLVFGQMEWHISGPLYDINNLNYIQEGTVTKNARELEKLERTLPGASLYVRDLTFLSDPQYANQTPQITETLNIVLPSPA